MKLNLININKGTLVIFNLLLILSIFSSPNLSFSQTKQSQLQCRSKAKEVAKTAFDECIELAKGDEAENIRKEFRMKFAKMKEYYQQKLRKVTAKMKKDVKNASSASAAANSTSTTPVNNLSNKLPPKVQTELPVNEETSNSSAITAPMAVNTQESTNPSDTNNSERGSTSILSSNNSASTTSKSETSEFSNEPIIRMKELPQSESLSTPSPNSEMPSQQQPSSEKIEVAPDSTI